MPIGASPEDLTRGVHRALEAERTLLAAWDAEILDTQVAVSRIPAPTGHERARGKWVAAQFGACGLETRSDDAGNVIARAPRTRRNEAPVVVAAHLDTVFTMDTPLEFVRNGARVTGPGVSDNGRGLAAMIALARVLPRVAEQWARPVEFVATTGEEGAGNLRGALHYVARAARPFAFIALDGAGDDSVVNSALGSRRFRVEYRGPGGHSWAAFGTANAIQAAARATTNLASMRMPASGRSTLTVSRIGGGLSVNAIPGDAWLDVDVRSTSEEALKRIESDLMEVVRAAAVEESRSATRGAGLTIHVERIGVRPAGETSVDSLLVRSAMEATRLVEREPSASVASTDANAFMAAGIPAITIGGGGAGGDAHTAHEWYDNTGAGAGLQRALTIVGAMATAPRQ